MNYFSFKKLFLFLGSLIAVYSLQARPIRIAFFVNLMTVRGVEVSTYDYADCNETILGNESIIVNWMPPDRHINCRLADRPESAKLKFLKRFEGKVYDVSSLQEMDQVLKRERIDILYIQKAGENDGKVSRVCKNAVHAVFLSYKYMARFMHVFLIG